MVQFAELCSWNVVLEGLVSRVPDLSVMKSAVGMLQSDACTAVQ